MEAQLEQIREQQREIWNRFSPGWKKWDDLTMDFLKPMGDKLIRLIKPKNDDFVLDVASGTGEPGLTIATMMNGGMVVITDLAEGMLDVARENAARRGIKNLEIITSDVSDLPFADNTFDAISCRFGFMFFPDILIATKEMLRVLKPGGRIALAVWNLPERNFWATAVLSAINKYMMLPPPQPGAPGLFRCAGDGFMAGFLHQAGFKNISETEVNSKLIPGSTEVYWNFMTEVVAPVVAALSKADQVTKIKIKDEVFGSINRRYPNGKVAFDSNAIIVYGEK
jgi:ubiquinone/menaquinone biosynthesis C-methylase UbiE